jgi:hypothetical protein
MEVQPPAARGAHCRPLDPRLGWGFAKTAQIPDLARITIAKNRPNPLANQTPIYYVPLVQGGAL